MKKTMLVFVLLIGVCLFPLYTSTQAEAMSIPNSLELQLDPANDVYEIVEGGLESMVEYPDIDILEISASIQTGSGITPDPRPLQDHLALTMQVQGNIITNDQDIRYIFVMGTSNDNVFVALANYSDITRRFEAWLLDVESGEPILPKPTVVRTGDGLLEIRVSVGSMNSPQRLEALRAITLDNRDESQRFGDMAPDKLVRITSPSRDATIWRGDVASFTFTGVCRKSQNNFIEVRVKLEDEWEIAAQGDDIEEWSIDMAVGHLHIGTHTVEVRAEDSEGIIFEDSLPFFIGDGNLETGPALSEMRNMRVGDEYHYAVEASQKLAGLDLSTTTEAKTTVERMESIGETPCLVVRTVEFGGAVLGAFEVEQTMERDSWRIADSQQEILKELTKTTQSIMKDGDPMSRTSTTTDLLYHDPFDQELIGKRVGEWWSVTASGTQTTTTVDEDGHEDTKTSTPAKTLVGEILYKGTVSPSEVPLLTSSEDVFFVKNSAGDNESAYSVLALSPNYSFPLMIDAYDGNRELVGRFVLERVIYGTGVREDITNIVWPSGEVTSEERVAFIVDIVNYGEEPSDAWVSLWIDGREVDNASVSLGVEEMASLDLHWTPRFEGRHLVEIRTVTDSRERNITVLPAPSADMTLYAAAGIAVAAILLIAFVALKRKRDARILDQWEKENGSKTILEKDDKKDKNNTEAFTEENGKEDGVVIETIDAPTRERPLSTEEVPVRCGKCGSTTRTIIPSKPYSFKCPDCGARLLIR